MKKQMNRRDFLRLSAMTVAGAAMAACQPRTVVVEKEVEKIVTQVVKETVKETVVVAGTPQVVEKEVTRVIEKEVETVVTPTPAAPAEMTVLITGDADILRRNIQPYLDRTPEIKLEIIMVPWDGYDEKTDLLIAGGDPPILWGNASKRNYRYYDAKNLIVDLTPLAEQDNYDLSDFLPQPTQEVHFKGRLMGLPAGHHATCLVYNKTLFDEAGVAYPPKDWEDNSWTWDEFLIKASALTKHEDDPLKTTWGWGFSMDVRYAQLTFGADLWREEDYDHGEPKTSLVTSEPMKEVYQLWQDWIWKYKITPSPEVKAAFSAVSPATLFVSGKAAMDLANTWDPPGTLADIEDFEYGLAVWPVNRWNGPRQYIYVDHWSMFKTEHIQAGWELLKYFASPEAQRISIAMQGEGAWPDVNRGGMTPRRSMMPEWASMMAGASKKSLKDIEEVIIKGADYGHRFSSRGAIKWPELLDVALYPGIDEILLNTSTVEEAVQKMDKKINEILATPL